MDYSNYFKYKHDENKESDENREEESPLSMTKGSSRIKSLIVVLLSGFLIIIYVSNVIEVKSLLRDIYLIGKQNDNLRDGNNILRMQINRLESADRITRIATDKFGMIKPDYPPQSLPQYKDTLK